MKITKFLLSAVIIVNSMAGNLSVKAIEKAGSVVKMDSETGIKVPNGYLINKTSKAFTKLKLYILK